MAYYLGKAEDDQTNLLLSETYTQGSKRLANDLQAAFHQIESIENQTLAYKNASIILEQATLRETRALMSVADVVGKNDNSSKKIAAMVERLKANKKVLMDDVDAYYMFKNNTSKTPKIELSLQELAASKKIPKNNPDLDAYFGNRRGGAPGVSIHSTMRMEVFNFVDGKRSYYDIYKAVLAEILAAGNWYYGTITLDEVEKLLDANVASGALSL
jgi:hypothetical protein